MGKAEFNYLLELCEGADIIIHLAAIVDFSEFLSKDQFEVNTVSSIRLARVAQKLKAHYIFISSTSIHGTTETYVSNELEDKPDSPYSFSKWLAEEIIKELYEKVTIVRICGIFGLNGPLHLGINKAISSAIKEKALPMVYGTGLAKRNYIYVKDVAKILTFIAEKKRLGKIYLAGKDIISIKSMEEQICEVFLSGGSPIYSEGNSSYNQIIKASNNLPETLSFKEALIDILKDYNG